MKIRKNEFNEKPCTVKNVEEHIQKVLYPFEVNAVSRGIKILITKKCSFSFKLIADWSMYQLILFNIIQNSVKYNSYQGQIMIVLDCVPIKKKNPKQLKKSSTSKIEDVP